jgi:hypothetical protein
MEIKMESVTCPQCGITFAITSTHDRNLRECHNTFFCPAGHAQSYRGETEAEKLRKQLVAKEQSLEYFRKQETERAAINLKKYEARMKRQRAAKKAKK